jgi:imidazolonepropionase-like amidohydrolase
VAALDLVEPQEIVLIFRRIVTLAGVLLAGVSIAASADSLALVGGRLIDGFGGPPLQDSVILISGNRISAVGRQGALAVPRDAQVIDARGKSVLPGLWEAHGHLFHVGEADPGAFQVKFADQLVPIMEAVARVTVQAGVTAMRDFCTSCSSQAAGWNSALLEDQKMLRARILAGEIPGPRLYFSGPALAPGSGKPGSRYDVATVQEATAATRKLVEAGVDNIFVGSHVWPAPLLDAIVGVARENKMGVDSEARHIAALRGVLDAGVDRVHVFFTADALAGYADDELRQLVRGVEPSTSGPSANILRGPWILCTLPMRQAYVTAKNFPGLLEHQRFREMFSPEVYRHLQEGWRAQQTIPWGVGADERVAVVKSKLREFIQAGGREQLVAATDAGAPLNFHSPISQQLRNLVEAGLTPMEAIQSATLRAAQMQGVADQVGTVTAGKLADLIVVDGDPLQQIEVLQYRVERVIQNGRLIK